MYINTVHRNNLKLISASRQYFVCELNNSYSILNIIFQKTFPCQRLQYVFISVETASNFLRSNTFTLSRFSEGIPVLAYLKEVFPHLVLSSQTLILSQYYSHFTLEAVFLFIFVLSTCLTLSGCQNSFQDKLIAYLTNQVGFR